MHIEVNLSDLIQTQFITNLNNIRSISIHIYIDIIWHLTCKTIFLFAAVNCK